MKTLFLATLLSLSSFASDTSTIAITGSSTVAPVISELAQAFERINQSNYRVDVQTGGSSRGIRDTLKGLNDIGMVSRSLKEKEKNKFKNIVIAQDGLAIILHASNNISTLSSQNIIDIYQGRITNWKELGGADLPIQVVHKASGRSTQELFLKFFKIKNRTVKPSIIIGDNEQGIKTIQNSRGAIGYVSIGTAQYNAKNKVPIKLLPFEGVEATINNVKNGSYPLNRELNLVYLKDSNKIKSFLKFVKNNPKIIEGHYFVPISQK